MPDTPNFNLKHSVLFVLLMFSYGCSSISPENLYITNDVLSAQETTEEKQVVTTKKEQQEADGKPRIQKSEQQNHTQNTIIPLVKESDFEDAIVTDEIKMFGASGNIDSSFFETDSRKLNKYCPEQFHDVKIPSNGKFCQSFATELPASIVFFVPTLPNNAVQFFINEHESLQIKQRIKDRILLSNSDNSTTLIVSPDGVGSQVDILVKR